MQIDWSKVKRVLVVRLRSIGDTVLATPSLIALQRFLPDAEIDILLETHVAPLLDGYTGVNVIPVGQSNASRLRTAKFLSSRKYDVAINLHGGTTSSIFVRASRARHRIGLSHYRYRRFYNHIYTSAADFWHSSELHSAEQQLAVLGFAGVPVEDRPKSRLAVMPEAVSTLEDRLAQSGAPVNKPIALIHPAAAFATKQWPTGNFARISELLIEKGFHVVAVATKDESQILAELSGETQFPITTFDSLTLPEIVALAAKASVFVGNDSGIAHIAAAVNTPSVVIFGSSNRTHWRPWTDAPNEIVFEPYDCQPCPGYKCEVYGDAPCIRNVSVENVSAAIERILS